MPVIRLMTVFGIGSVNSAMRSTVPLRPSRGAANSATTSAIWLSMRAIAFGVKAVADQATDAAMVVVLERQQVVVSQPAGAGPLGGRFVELPGPPVRRGDINRRREAASRPRGA